MIMFRSNLKALAAGFCLIFAAGVADTRTARPFTAADLVALDRVSDPQLSPDGKVLLYGLRVADVAGNSARSELWLVNADGKSRARRVAGEVNSASRGRWSRDGAFIYFTSKAGDTMQLWRIAPDGAGLRQITDLSVDIGSYRISPTGDAVIFSMAVFPDCASLQCTRDRLRPANGTPTGRRYGRQPIRLWDNWSDGTQNRLFMLTLGESGAAEGAPRALLGGFDGDVPSRPEGDDSDFVITPDGKYVIFTAYDASASVPWGTNFDLYRAPIDGSGRLENLTSGNPALDIAPTVSPDGRFLAYRATARVGYESDRQRIVIRDLASSNSREVAPAWDRSVDLMTWAPDGRRIYAVARDIGQGRIFEVDLASDRVRALTGKGRVTAVAAAGSTLVYAHEDLGNPAQFYRAAAKRPVVLTHHNRERLSQLSFGDFEQFSFKGWGDETVYAYLVKPADFDPAKTYPVAFLIHGGPQGSLSNFFDYRWNAQTYSGRGYAVLMVDFHGSKGYGQKFQESVSEHWGDRPLEDLKKGWAEALRRYPFLDANRACALGASYGGYMVNWIASQWKEPWKCLVNHAGIFDYRMNSYSIDLFSFMEWENGGPPYERPNHAWFNPADYVAQWSLPMLVTHGEKDYRVAIEQGIATFAALQRKGIPSELIYYPDENHRILKPGNSLQWHRAVEEWLARWTAPAK